MAYNAYGTFTINPAAANTPYTIFTFGSAGIYRIKINTYYLPVNYLLDLSLQQYDTSSKVNLYEMSDGHWDISNAVAPPAQPANGYGPFWETEFDISIPYGGVLVYQVIMLNGTAFAALTTPLNGIAEQA